MKRILISGSKGGIGKSTIAVSLAKELTKRGYKIGILDADIVAPNVPILLGFEERPKLEYKDDRIVPIEKDGIKVVSYWFEIDGVAATKEQVTRLLGKLGIDPDNMLIIMHQGMVERFVALDPRERLLLMEEAAGLREFRLNVIKARRKLEKALSEEKAVRELLGSARQTLEYWREQYERYQEKKELLMKKAFLERELAWSHALRWEEEVSSLRRAREVISEELASIGSEIEELGSREGELRGKLSALRAEARSKVNEAVEQERLASKAGILLKLASGMGGQLSSTLVELCRSELGLDVGESEFQVALARLAEEAQEKADRALGRALELEAELADLFERLMNILVRLEVLKFKREQLLAELKDLEGKLRLKEARLRELVAKAKALGPRVPAPRPAEGIQDELRRVEGHLLALRDVGEEAERMYKRYSELYSELEAKARAVRERREEAMKEVRKRMEAWRSVVGKMVEDVSSRFRAILSRVQGDGSVSLVNAEDIEEAGVRITVGFRGSKPIELDAYTQSGGERSVATVAFLLALQQHVRSPFRAIDEYDVHLDPLNRRRLAEALVSVVEQSGVQYVVITPGPFPFAGKDVRILTVQCVEGESVVKLLRP